jgi:hypothetical protein
MRLRMKCGWLLLPSIIIVMSMAFQCSCDLPTQKRWAFATLLTDGNERYTAQVALLLSQLKHMYPLVDRLVIVKPDGAPSHLANDLATRLLPRSPFPHAIAVPGVYADQHLKLWLWNELEYERIVYMDGDTFFLTPDTIDFVGLMAESEAVIACPTPWSEDVYRTWNGGFFILRPNVDTFEALQLAATTPSGNTHFQTLYGDLGWLDQTEMGALATVFPTFHTPRNFTAYCGEVTPCCVRPEARHCRHMGRVTYADANMVHGLKPDFERQAREVFGPWGIDPQCVLDRYVAPLLQLMDAAV